MKEESLLPTYVDPECRKAVEEQIAKECATWMRQQIMDGARSELRDAWLNFEKTFNSFKEFSGDSLEFAYQSSWFSATIAAETRHLEALRVKDAENEKLRMDKQILEHNEEVALVKIEELQARIKNLVTVGEMQFKKAIETGSKIPALESRIEKLREALTKIEDLPPLNERERRTVSREALAADDKAKEMSK